jgi:biopolymer transport protein ExbD
MMRPIRSKPPAGIHDPNLTPLIDVSLVLVVILLVATPFALQSGIAVSHAAASGRSGPAAHVARVEITIVDAQNVMLNRSPVPMSALGSRLEPLIAASPTREVFVHCGDAVPHGSFVSVLDEAKRCGASRISVAGS